MWACEKVVIKSSGGYSVITARLLLELFQELLFLLTPLVFLLPPYFHEVPSCSRRKSANFSLSPAVGHDFTPGVGKGQGSATYKQVLFTL